MQSVLTRRAALLGLVLALVTGLTAGPASAQFRRFDPPGNAAVSGTITAIDAAAGSLQITTRNGLSVTLRTNQSTVVVRDRQRATFADLKANDLVVAFYDRQSLVALRIEAASPPPTDLTGTITSLDAAAGTVQVTTDHGTAVTLTANADSRIRLNGRTTTVGNVGVGQRARVTYRPENKIVLTLDATTPRADVVSGAITALDLTARTIQLTSVAGVQRNLNLAQNAEFRLNGRRVAANSLAVGYLASVQLGAGDAARVVAAETPPLINLAGSISALNVQGGTIEITTQAMTSIALRLLATTAVERNDMAATVEQLAVGDRVVVRYEYLLLPGQSRALRIDATAAPAPPTPPEPPAAASLASVSLEPTSVEGGNPVTGTVTLSAAAPAGGATVTLASSNTAAATVPASVVVPEGMTSATFTVTTVGVAAATPVSISATYAGNTVQAELTVNPAAGAPTP